MNKKCFTVGKGIAGRQLLESLNAKKLQSPVIRKVVMVPVRVQPPTSHHKASCFGGASFFVLTAAPAQSTAYCH